ncbi:Response regulator receiver domain-containing protein [Micromonospora pattaloongensis]|uniref:Response regulator receiver domain-containing protein n=1 Tax=Micromonospora pattaloongensis TaxID=405436 RepID=A0A1H3MVE0_9ACTN|nr:response regulator [Micromonospora pattaloongensis]SDY80464.1 Response regulator receiver domain-containing protein [Micromonospora pattaloongensis]
MPESATAPFPATVLVVDDEEDLREVMRRMLERRGYRTLTAAGPAEAEVLCEHHDGVIDLLLTDLGMPDASGGDLARTLTRMRPDLRVVFVSGLPAEVAVGKGLLSIDDHLVQKPFTSEALVSAVRDTLLAGAPLTEGVLEPS